MPQMSQLPFLGLKLVPKPGEMARRAGRTQEPWSWGGGGSCTKLRWWGGNDSGRLSGGGKGWVLRWGQCCGVNGLGGPSGLAASSR